MRRALRQFWSLSRSERRELSLACAWQLRFRVVLLRGDAMLRLSRLASRRGRRVSSPLSADRVERLARWSGALCRGSCLTTAFVHEVLARRHGLERPVSVGVLRDGDALRAHAWAGDPTASGPFAALWSDARDERR
jgi:hypothetical protein